MTASANIKTPSMDLPVKTEKKSKKRAKQLQRKFTKVTLAQVLYFQRYLQSKRCSMSGLHQINIYCAVAVAYS